ncbi:MAG: 2-succinyl-5-enolpyruvyl-6-hydroxy-3-cyclohexene-1-carboxylic-acid synthase [Pseudomonadota bacterium]|nr:2-succinyl-5-enolpyruvyl-6-hydroxy-3-cyclohexene-1-carboxylic-acid synthase [Pseudomonadota bacterium]
MNISLANDILKQLANVGVKEIALCPGARNSPLVTLLDSTQTFKVFNFFDERAAAFFALGRMRQTSQPLALFTTSGTAAAELLPGMVEAHYTGAPLIAVTADRPRKCRGTGSPQSINQLKLFGEHVEHFLDLATNEFWNLDGWLKAGPLHLNVCFDEPLIDEEIGSRQYATSEFESGNILTQKKINEQREIFSEFLNKYKNPIFVLGGLHPSESSEIESFLKNTGALVFAEGLSNLRESTILKNQILVSGDSLLNANNFDGLVRIGGVPTTRFWRDIENNPKMMPIISVSNLPFSGLSHGKLVHTNLQQFFSKFVCPVKSDSEKKATILMNDRARYREVMALLDREPTSEPAMLHRLSLLIEKKSQIYLGNSSPIREWELFATRENRSWELFGQRGVNGIDGQISSFLGYAHPKKPNWGIFGDLTAMYDLSAPWILKQLEAKNIKIVVVNNGGGQIFSRMFTSKSFLNEHQLQFQHWAKMWDLPWSRWEKIPNQFEESQPTVIELAPDRDATHRFWDSF